VNTPLLSVVVPVLNEGEGLVDFVQQLLEFVGEDNQVIIADGGSQDNNFAQLKVLENAKANLYLIRSSKGRALQMNAGAKLATGENLLFLHADTLLPESALKELESFSISPLQWGRFDVCLNNPAWPYKIISWFINHRSRLTSISTGDQAIFLRRDLFEQINGYTQQPLMEDVDLTCRLKKISLPFCIDKPVTTSARKWEKEGVIKTVWLMWKLRAAYARGVSPEILVKQYYHNNKTDEIV